MILYWTVIVIIVEGAFLQVKFTNSEQMHIKVLDRTETFYGSMKDVALLLRVRNYGTMQAVHCFYKIQVKEIEDQNYTWSKADPHLYGDMVGGL